MTRGKGRAAIAPAPRHVIARAVYQVDQVAVPLEARRIVCSCGADVPALEWEAHRGPTASQQRVERNHEAFAARVRGKR